jgi:hypothetical protein
MIMSFLHGVTRWAAPNACGGSVGAKGTAELGGRRLLGGEGVAARARGRVEEAGLEQDRSVVWRARGVQVVAGAPHVAPAGGGLAVLVAVFRPAGGLQQIVPRATALAGRLAGVHPAAVVRAGEVTHLGQVGLGDDGPSRAAERQGQRQEPPSYRSAGPQGHDASR